MGATQPPLTFEEFERLEFEWPAKTELLEGEVFHLLPATVKEGDLTESLFLRLSEELEALRATSPEFVFGEPWMGRSGFLVEHSPGSWLIPAISITWREQCANDYWEGIPMIAFEIMAHDYDETLLYFTEAIDFHPEALVTGSQMDLDGNYASAGSLLSGPDYPAYIARKVKKYLQCGAAEVWVLHPESRHAMVYTPTGERREENAFHSELLPGIEIPFAEFL
jgi:hypothetical protein